MEMKRTLISSFFLSCFFLILSSPLSAQSVTPDIFDPVSNFPPGTAIVDNQRGSLILGQGEEPCDGILNVVVYVSNLVEIENAEGISYIYPVDADHVFLKYSIGETSGIVYVDDFKKSEQQSQSGDDVFEKRLVILVDLYESCPSSKEPYEPRNGIELNYNIELMANTWGMPYPFESNEGPDDLFSCKIFCDDGCPDLEAGPPPAGSCVVSGSYNETWNGRLFLDCRSCYGPRPKVELPPESPSDIDGGAGLITRPRGEVSRDQELAEINNQPATDIPSVEGATGRSDNDESVQVIKVMVNNVQVMPNPFKSETNILYHTDTTESLDITIFDASGKQVYQQTAEAHKGLNTIKVPSNAWNSGIFYGQIKSGTTVRSFKLMKIN